MLGFQIQLLLLNIRRLKIHEDDPCLDESVTRQVHPAHGIGCCACEQAAVIRRPAQRHDHAARKLWSLPMR